MLLANSFSFVTTASSGAAHQHHEVPFSITLLFALLLTAMIAALALEEKLHCKKSLITGLFAALCLPVADFFGIMPLGPLINVFGEKIALPIFIPAVDWEVIAIILGSGIFVDVVSQCGLFTWIAISLTKRSGGDPLKLMQYYGWLTVLFSAFLNNVTAIIIIGSLTAVSLNKLKKRELLLGFLLIEGLLTNVGGLLTLISSVPNIIAGNAAQISFMKFFFVASPYVAFTAWLTIKMGAKLFKINPLTTDEEKAEAAELVAGFDENDGIISMRFFYTGIVAFVGLIVCFATASVMPVIKDLGLGYVAVTFALLMLIVYKHEVNRFYSAVDWDLIGFFVFLFIVINVMEHAQVLNLVGKGIAALLSTGEISGKISLLWGSAIVSSVTDNIPLTAVLAKVLTSLQTPSDSSLWWAVIFGANLGGNITPIGSASTLVAVAIMHKHEVKLGFGSFVVKAVPFAIVQLILATGYVLLVL